MQSGTKFTWVNTGTIDVSKITPEIDHNPVPETLTRDGSSVEKEKGFDGSNDSIVLVHGPDGCGNGKKLGRENVVSEESLDSGLKDAGGHESKSVDGGSGCQLGGRLNAGCEGAGNSPGHLEGDSHWSVGEPEAVSNDVSVHCKDQYMRGHDSNDNKSDGLENQAMKIEAQNNASNNQEASWAEVMDMVGSPELCTKRNGDLKSDDCICVREIVTSNAKMISPPENSAVKCDIIGEHDHDSQKVNEKEGEFCVSDLVWGKVRSHPWWPGQIFDPSDASKLAKKYSKPNAYLIAYFGDKTFAWNEEQKLKPFWQHFSEMEKQSGTESFQFAVNCALDEALRRVELALACPCLAKDVYDDLKTQVVKNAGIQEESSRIQESPLPPPSCSPEEKVEASSTQTNGSYLEDQLMSEIHLGCPPHIFGPLISHFTFSVPLDMESKKCGHNDCSKDKETSQLQNFYTDEDGDLLVSRRSMTSGLSGGITIQHNAMSSLPDVGLQVWRAELVLADFILHKMNSSSEFDGISAVELGAGTGLAGILLGRAAETVFITDYGEEILDNCAKNVELNSGLFRSKSSVFVRELNWKETWPPSIDSENFPQKRYSWESSEAAEANRATLLLAADVIYSDDLTDAFFSIVEQLMSRGSEKVLYLALEKRYNFSLSDLDIVANGYSHFRSYLKVDEGSESIGDGYLPAFMGKLIDLELIPEYIQEYERGKDVELWEIKYNRRMTNYLYRV